MLLKNKKIPKCYICKYLMRRELSIRYVEYCCAAQGFKSVNNVYNNKICKKIYDEITDKKKSIISRSDKMFKGG